MQTPYAHRSVVTLLLLPLCSAMVIAACTRPPTRGPRTPPAGICASPAPLTVCGVPGFGTRVQGLGDDVLVGASGLALLDGTLYTVLEAKGLGAGIEATDSGAGAVVRGVLFRASARHPATWEPMDITLSSQCLKLTTELSGDHWRKDLELESVDVRRGARGELRIAVGSDFGFVATGELSGRVAALVRCTASTRALPNNKAFEAVTLAESATGGVMAFEEEAVRADATAPPATSRAATPEHDAKTWRYRRQWLGAHGAADRDSRALRAARDSALHAPPAPEGCRKAPRIAGSARVGQGTVLVMSCKAIGGGYRYFLGAVGPTSRAVAVIAIRNTQFGRLSPNLEGLASEGGCLDPLWIIADDHNSAGAPTVMGTISVPEAFRGVLRCGRSSDPPAASR